MKFQMPFNEKIYKNETNLLFKIDWNFFLKTNKKRLLIGVSSLLFSFLLFYNEKDSGFIFFAIAIHYFINYCNSYHAYENRKLKYEKKIEELILSNKKHGENSVWIFEGDFFFNSFNGIETKYEWQKFDKFEIIEIIENILITYFYKTDVVGFVLSEEELGKDRFNEIIKFLGTKLEKIWKKK